MYGVPNFDLNEKIDINIDNLELFFYTMYERQEIWYKRMILKKERPWTDDQILNDYKFTNVYRELDRNSQYQIQNILLSYNKTEKDIIWKLILFRIFNNPELFDFIENITINAENSGYEEYNFIGKFPNYKIYNKEDFYEFIKWFRESGKNPFTNAYVTNSLACPGQSRDWCYGNKVVPEIHNKIPEILNCVKNSNNVKELIEIFKEIPGVADFMAHELYQDLTYIKKYTNLNIFRWDQNSYTNIGPGASSGISFIFPHLKTNNEKIKSICFLRDISKEYLLKFGNFKYIEWDKREYKYKILKKSNLSLHQIEMWLCEFSKYYKVKTNTGKQRSMFTPRKTYKIKKFSD